MTRWTVRWPRSLAHKCSPSACAWRSTLTRAPAEPCKIVTYHRALTPLGTEGLQRFSVFRPVGCEAPVGTFGSSTGPEGASTYRCFAPAAPEGRSGSRRCEAPTIFDASKTRRCKHLQVLRTRSALPASSHKIFYKYVAFASKRL